MFTLHLACYIFSSSFSERLYDFVATIFSWYKDVDANNIFLHSIKY